MGAKRLLLRADPRARSFARPQSRAACLQSTATSAAGAAVGDSLWSSVDMGTADKERESVIAKLPFVPVTIVWRVRLLLNIHTLAGNPSSRPPIMNLADLRPNHWLLLANDFAGFAVSCSSQIREVRRKRQSSPHLTACVLYVGSMHCRLRGAAHRDLSTGWPHLLPSLTGARTHGCNLMASGPRNLSGA